MKDIVSMGKRWLYLEGGAKEFKGHSQKEIDGGIVHFFRGTVEKNKKAVRCMIVVDDDGTVHAPEKLSTSYKKRLGRVIRKEERR